MNDDELENNEIDFDEVGSEAYRAADSGLTEASCRYADGSCEHNHWNHEFWNRKCQPYIALGVKAAKEGIPITDVPTNVASRLQNAWKMGWTVTDDGPFGGLKGVIFTHVQVPREQKSK